jgi:hypothetical protein
LSERDQKKGISIRHTTNLASRVVDAKRALGLACKQFDTFKESAQALAATKVEPIPYFHGVLDAILDITQAEASQGASSLARALAVTEAERKIAEAKIAKEIDQRKALFAEVMDRYESKNNGIQDMRGTGWAALNAVTEAADHGKLGGRYTGNEDEKASRRFESVVDGRADEVKQVAYQQVLAYVK